jgi:hypothetical protein
MHPRSTLALGLLAVAATAAAVEPPTFTVVDDGTGAGFVMFEWRGARVSFLDSAWQHTEKCKHGFTVPYGGFTEVHVVGGTYGAATISYAHFGSRN